MRPSSRCSFESKINLGQVQESNLRESLNRMLQKCPEFCGIHLEVGQVGMDLSFYLEVTNAPMPISAFTIGPDFYQALSDLEFELEIQLTYQSRHKEVNGQTIRQSA